MDGAKMGICPVQLHFLQEVNWCLCTFKKLLVVPAPVTHHDCESISNVNAPKHGIIYYII